jgi:aminoglycoside phosphotransferase (APT) family kinase protein
MSQPSGLPKPAMPDSSVAEHRSTVNPFEQVARRLGGTLARHWPLPGGVSAQVTALELALPGGETKKVVVRQHGPVDRKQNPNIAADEFELLRLLLEEGLAVPAPYLADTSGEIFPTPYLVVEFVDGETDFAPADLPGYLAQFAAYLARVHSIRDAGRKFAFLPQGAQSFTERFGECPAQPNDSLSEGRIRETLQPVWPIPQVNETVLLHGDFWPGNVLWTGGRLRAVIDWEDALLGDPLSDLGKSRLEILWAFGGEAMDDYTAQYRAAMPALDYRPLPYWDLAAALRPIGKITGWAGDEKKAAAMRERHRWLVAVAFARL